MWTRSLLKAHAKENFKRNYWRTVVVSLVLSICVGGGIGINFTYNGGNFNAAVNGVNNPAKNTPFIHQLGFSGMSRGLLLGVVSVIAFIFFVAFVIGLAMRILLFQPLEVGARRYFLDNHNEPAMLQGLGFSFEKSRYGNIVKTQFLKSLYLFLWSLLFVIPGIVKTYSYRLVPFILADDPNMDANEAITLSRRLMSGNKWRAFVLDLSFILWEFLNLLTVGILGILWVNPYIYSTDTELYLVLRYGIANPSNFTQQQGDGFYDPQNAAAGSSDANNTEY